MALAIFRSLELLLDPPAGDDRFDRSLAELIATAKTLDQLELYACSASVETMALTAEDVGGRLDGVMSTPRFLERAQGARLLFV